VVGLPNVERLRYKMQERSAREAGGKTLSGFVYDMSFATSDASPNECKVAPELPPAIGWLAN